MYILSDKIASECGKIYRKNNKDDLFKISCAINVSKRHLKNIFSGIAESLSSMQVSTHVKYLAEFISVLSFHVFTVRR